MPTVKRSYQIPSLYRGPASTSIRKTLYAAGARHHSPGIIRVNEMLSPNTFVATGELVAHKRRRRQGRKKTQAKDAAPIAVCSDAQHLLCIKLGGFRKHRNAKEFLIHESAFAIRARRAQYFVWQTDWFTALVCYVIANDDEQRRHAGPKGARIGTFLEFGEIDTVA